MIRKKETAYTKIFAKHYSRVRSIRRYLRAMERKQNAPDELAFTDTTEGLILPTVDSSRTHRRLISRLLSAASGSDVT